ncbi:TrbI/VirB10 family protein, partial [Gluconobacter thailandicus]|uniref:TrbI/VirB10 family protein n=1 Tax=Gluconobacter thailandicus TaxID=257438 RepID=UPI00036A9326
QGGKRAFLSGQPDRLTTSPDRVMPAASPYVLQAGTVIAGALNTKISSDLPGQITGHVTQNVYDSPTGRFLLIPQGSLLFGAYNSGISFGQQRTQIIWTRLIFPNGSSLVLEKLPGADAIGQSGLSDEVNNHWGQLFKAALVTTLLSVGSEAGTSWNENNLMQAIRSGASNGFSMVGNRLIDRSLNVQPTLTDRPGLPFTVILNRDLILKACASQVIVGNWANGSSEESATTIFSVYNALMWRISWASVRGDGASGEKAISISRLRRAGTKESGENSPETRRVSWKVSE